MNKLMSMLVLVLLIVLGCSSDAQKAKDAYEVWKPYMQQFEEMGLVSDIEIEGKYALLVLEDAWVILTTEQRNTLCLGAYATSISRENLDPGAMIMTLPDWKVVAFIDPKGKFKIFEESEVKTLQELGK